MFLKLCSNLSVYRMILTFNSLKLNLNASLQFKSKSNSLCKQSVYRKCLWHETSALYQHKAIFKSIFQIKLHSSSALTAESTPQRLYVKIMTAGNSQVEAGGNMLDSLTCSYVERGEVLLGEKKIFDTTHFKSKQNTNIEPIMCLVSLGLQIAKFFGKTPGFTSYLWFFLNCDF